MKGVFEVIKFIGLLIWQLPQSIIGWLMILWFVIIGKVKFMHYHKHAFVFTADKMNGSISLGTIIILCTSHSKSKPTIQHEFGHIFQSQYLGWLYLLVIGIPSICWAAIHNPANGISYYSFYPEMWANTLGKVEDYKYGLYYRLKIIEDILWE